MARVYAPQIRPDGARVVSSLGAICLTNAGWQEDLRRIRVDPGGANYAA